MVGAALTCLAWRVYDGVVDIADDTAFERVHSVAHIINASVEDRIHVHAVKASANHQHYHHLSYPRASTNTDMRVFIVGAMPCIVPVRELFKLSSAVSMLSISPLTVPITVDTLHTLHASVRSAL